MTAPLTPYPGFDPEDGEDPRVELSADNPCRCDARRSPSGTGSGAADLSFHGEAV